MGIVYSILLGCLAGFRAGKLMKGGGFGFIVNVILGLLLLAMPVSITR